MPEESRFNGQGSKGLAQLYLCRNLVGDKEARNVCFVKETPWLFHMGMLRVLTLRTRDVNGKLAAFV